MKSLLYIGNQLSKHGFTPTSIETLGPQLETEGYVLYYASSKKNQGLRILDMLLTVFRHRKQLDLIVIDTYSTLNFWYAVAVGFLAKAYHIPYIPILHGGNLPSRLTKNPRICRNLFGQATVNVAPSQYLQEAFQKFGILNVKYIPNTISIAQYPYIERTISTPHLLWVRSFAKIYNPMMAVAVFEKVKRLYPDATLTMVGPEKDGALEETKAFASSKKVTVNFTGRLSKPDWIALAKDCNVFINTTNFDNTPVSVIESMALGLPVISTNVGGVPFLLEDKKEALLVAPNAVDDMVEAIKLLCTDESYARKLSVAARSKAERFDWHAVKELWKEVI